MKKRISIIFVSVLMALVAFGGIAFAWPQLADGRPSEFRPGHSRGYFIWTDNSGFNLRSTSNRSGHVFSGVIRTNGQFTNIRRLREEPGDRLQVDNDDNTIRFHFRTTANDADGLDFRVRGGSSVHFELFVDGNPISTQEIHLGRYNRHPHDNSFSLYR